LTVYPFEIDDDRTILRVDGNITETGGDSINQCREAIFALEEEAGINPSGSKESIAERLNVSLNANGTIKSSALTSVGLVTLPIDNSEVGANAGIVETKLALDYSTSDLYTLISANLGLLNSLNTFANNTFSDLNVHIAGGTTLSSGDPARHVASHIDLNTTPQDARDLSYIWSGLQDKDGVNRTATHVGSALDQINTALTSHENAVADAHVATAVTVNTDSFEEIPTDATTVQAALDAIDEYEVANIGQHRATQHANAIPPIARSQLLATYDGYSTGYTQNVVPPTPVNAYLVHVPKVEPTDSLTIGDDLVAFNPNNASFIFDSQFSQVEIGDTITVNYGNGTAGVYHVEGIRYDPGNEWVIRLDSVNLIDSDGYQAWARIDRPKYDTKTAGVLAVAAANATPASQFSTIMGSVIVGSPKGAMALGLGFDANQLDADHYNLYLEFYPTGNPADKVIAMPAIDVTGNAGATPGDYTLESVVQTVNNSFREIGYNYRFIAFAHNGDFGIMLADAIDGASFAIISGSNSTGTLVVGTYTDNVLGEALGDTFDALGFGSSHADLASPAYITSFADATAAQLPTKVIMPMQYRYYTVNGRKRDGFAATHEANDDGYWDGYVSSRLQTALTVETTYTVELDLKAAGLRPGMTLVVQPAVDFSDLTYSDVDYGRFIIKEIVFPTVCAGGSQATLITVINGIHATGSGTGSSATPNQPVKLYFSEDSVTFNREHVINSTPTTFDYRRLHEIYINDEGKTFSHERARMPVQNEGSSPDHIATSKWHIKDVSQKLRGYRDDATSFNKYVRFYVLSYNATTGEYDGYLCQRDPLSDGILAYGPRTTGRKNVVTRFYDETYVDYIDLEFVDTAAGSPGDAILGAISQGYVDIEIFDTVRTHDEYFLLATCEVNWDPISGQDTVEHVIDRRQFGSVDENDFTDSAQEYISAGEKYLHQNGVISGFDFDYVNTSDDREVFFKGGKALVDGKICTVNNLSVTIPNIYDSVAGKPATIDWAVCVNKNNYLEPIIVTSSKQQFFATDGTSTYYVPSVTFSELVNTRKDLTPIAIVTANISSFIINDSDVVDIRKFVAQEGANSPLVVHANGFVGNFATFEAVKQWVNNYGNDSSGKFIVTVRGKFEISSSLDLEDFSYQVEFVGDGAYFDVTADQGIIVNGNVTLKNMVFNYTPTVGGYTANDYINVGNGCIYRTAQGSATGTISQNISIEDCEFNTPSTHTGQRPPYICFELNKNDALDKINIRRNQFNDVDDSTTKYQAAVAIVNLCGGTGTGVAVLSNSVIEENVCKYFEGIYVVSDGTLPLTPPGLFVSNTIIRKNQAGAIGYLISSSPSATFSETNGKDSSSGLQILENTSHFIGTMTDTGVGLVNPGAAEITYGLGNVVISRNVCNWIHSFTEYDAYYPGALDISHNILNAYDTTFLETRIWVGATVFFESCAIASITQDDGYGNTQICNNTIASIEGTTYDNGIYLKGAGTVSGNIVSGFEDDAAGLQGGVGIILVSSKANNDEQVLVTNNRLYRDPLADVYAYVSGYPGSVSNRPKAVIVDNFFDDPYVDVAESDLDTIKHTAPHWIFERNINQTVVAKIGAWLGSKTIGTGTGQKTVVGVDPVATTSIVAISNDLSGSTVLRLAYSDSGTSVVAEWIVSLEGVLPSGVTIVTIDCDVSITPSVATTTGNVTMYLNDVVTFGTEASNPIDLKSSTTGTCSLPQASWSKTFINNPGNALAVYLKMTINDTGTKSGYMDAIEITYRW
jgi:hypothetical protein